MTSDEIRNAVVAIREPAIDVQSRLQQNPHAGGMSDDRAMLFWSINEARRAADQLEKEAGRGPHRCRGVGGGRRGCAVWH